MKQTNKELAFVEKIAEAMKVNGTPEIIYLGEVEYNIFVPWLKRLKAQGGYPQLPIPPYSYMGIKVIKTNTRKHFGFGFNARKTI